MRQTSDAGVSGVIVSALLVGTWVLTLGIVGGIFLGSAEKEHAALKEAIAGIGSKADGVSGLFREVGDQLNEYLPEVADGLDEVLEKLEELPMLLPEGSRIARNLGPVEFNTESHAIGEAQVKTLVADVKKAVDDRRADILVLGFADSCGSAAGNLNLSERRAESVAGTLLSLLNGGTAYVLGMGEGVGRFGSGACHSQLHRSAHVFLLAPELDE